MPEKNRVDGLTKEFGHIKSKFKRDFIKTILYTRVAAGLENHEEGYDKTGFAGCDPAWEKVNELLVKLAERNPKRAFLEAVNLVLLPKSEDPKQERVNKWIRTTGLTFMGDNIDGLNKYLNRGKHKSALAATLSENILTKLDSFDSEDKFYDPQGFTVIQSIYLGYRLAHAKHPSTSDICVFAESRRNQPDIIQATEVIRNIPGCRYLADILKKD